MAHSPRSRTLAIRDEFLNLDFPSMGQVFDYSNHPFMTALTREVLEPMYQVFLVIHEDATWRSELKSKGERVAMRNKVREYLELAVRPVSSWSKFAFVTRRRFVSRFPGETIRYSDPAWATGRRFPSSGSSRRLVIVGNASGPPVWLHGRRAPDTTRHSERKDGLSLPIFGKAPVTGGGSHQQGQCGGSSEGPDGGFVGW